MAFRAGKRQERFPLLDRDRQRRNERFVEAAAVHGFLSPAINYTEVAGFCNIFGPQADHSKVKVETRVSIGFLGTPRSLPLSRSADNLLKNMGKQSNAFFLLPTSGTTMPKIARR
jgi:hypothetical protein